MPLAFPNSYYTHHFALREHIVEDLGFGKLRFKRLRYGLSDNSMADFRIRLRLVDWIEERIQG